MCRFTGSLGRSRSESRLGGGGVVRSVDAALAFLLNINNRGNISLGASIFLLLWSGGVGTLPTFKKLIRF
jgi:hypothetical protein